MVARFNLQLRTKNFSNKELKGVIELPLRCVYRAGSTTPTQDIFRNSYGKRKIIEINSVDSIENSRSKLLMKECFAKAEVPQADWCISTKYSDNNDGYLTFVKSTDKGIEYTTDTAPWSDNYDPNILQYPILAKRINGFKGKGMVKIEDQARLDKFLAETSANQLSGYYFEEFKNWGREYRLHMTQDECFMSWRKLRKAETADDKRWFFNSENCNWVGVDHELYDKPVNWDNIVEDCKKAMVTTGLDIGCFDVRMQTSKCKKPEYILVEVNSAPALAEAGIAAYKAQLVKVFNYKTK